MPETVGSVPLVPTIPLDKTLEAIGGFIKANTSDVLGAPADIAYVINKATSKNAEPAPPTYGSAYFRKLFFGPEAVETKSLTEVGGSLVSPSGVLGVGKAMVVGAIPKLALSGVSAKSAANILTKVDELTASDSAVEFFQRTGVFKGVEGAAKTVISDATATLNPKLLSKTISDTGVINTVLSKDVKLGEVLDHPKLYKLYPGLKDINVKTDMSYKLNEAAFDAKNNTMILGPHASTDKAMASVLHEVQHAVQDTERFAFGTNPEVNRVFGAVELTPERLTNIRKLRDEGNPHAQKISDMLNADTRAAFEKYRVNPGEAEARFTESTMKLSQQQLEDRVIEVLKNPLPVSFWDK